MSEEPKVQAAPVAPPATNQPRPDPAEKEMIQEDVNKKPINQEEKDRQRAFEAYSKDETSAAAKMSIKVYSPSRIYFDGAAFSVTATNDTGEFDILPQHHNFISLLNPCDLIVRTIGEGNRKISISGGLLHVKTDRVVVFLDI
jgi:hypothetical protein